MSIEEIQAPLKDKLRALVRHAAEERARVYSRRDDLQLAEMPKAHREGNVLGNWMSLILLGGETIRMTLKLHFAYKDVKAIAHPIYGAATPGDMSDTQATDFVKELCNLIGGYLVQIFEKNELSLGISLPLCTRGLYEVFADYTPASQPLIRYSDCWRLEVDGVHFPGTVLIEIMDVEGASKLLNYEPTEESEEDDDDEGFDFL
ncbi:hypothetical protein QQM79_08780 [Marinobacteraceae bacterium S3BR75-40.1]